MLTRRELIEKKQQIRSVLIFLHSSVSSSIPCAIAVLLHVRCIRTVPSQQLPVAKTDQLDHSFFMLFRFIRAYILLMQTGKILISLLG